MSAPTTFRSCRYCGGDVTATDPAVDYCAGCYYAGTPIREQLATFVDALGADVWHTGGGCFAVYVPIPGATDDADPSRYVLLTGACGDLPESDDPEFRWIAAYYDETTEGAWWPIVSEYETPDGDGVRRDDVIAAVRTFLAAPLPAPDAEGWQG